MSLIRAFTTRRNNKQEGDGWKGLHIGRAVSQRAVKPVKRDMISSPLELVSTTNMLSYEAPDIAGTKRIGIRHISSSISEASVSGGEESDVSALSIVTGGTFTDVSSAEHSPTTPEPKENHLSCYFNPSVNTQSSNTSPYASARQSFDAPAIPQRMPSHSKKAHERLHRQRSLQRIISPMKRTSAESVDKSIDEEDEPSHDGPFGNELAQLDEVAEEFGRAFQDTRLEDDEAAMKTLAVFSADDYLAEIAGESFRLFHDETPLWI